MVKKTNSSTRREESLSRERIIKVSIELLDSGGERGLTFRTLAERLATGPGALYWHVASKDDLMTAACDAIVARAVEMPVVGSSPQASIRAVALALFDAMDAHPWVGSALARSAGQLPMVRIIDRLGQQLRALGVRDEHQWATVSVLLNYTLGVGGQNAANGQIARTRSTDRSSFLDSAANMWSQLDPNEYPFARSITQQLRAHDDRADFLAGIDLILEGMRRLQNFSQVSD